MVRFGRVVQIDVDYCRARVEFEDVDTPVSYWLQIVQPKTLKDKSYWLPDVGEKVACLINDNPRDPRYALDDGVVLGAIYNEKDVAPEGASPDKHIVTFSDGTRIEYDRSTHQMLLNLSGDCQVTIAGNCQVQIDEQLEITVKKVLLEQLTDLNGDIERLLFNTTRASIIGLRCQFTGLDHL